MPSLRHTTRPDPELLARCFGCTYPRGHAVGDHVHDWDQLVFAAEGAIRVLAGGHAWLVPADRALRVPAGLRHDLVAASPVTLRTLYLHPDEGIVPAGGCEAIEVSPLLRQLILHAVRLGRLRRADPHEARCLEMIRDLLASQPRATVGLPLPTDSRALTVARRLLDDPGQDVGLDRLAREAGASRRTLERLFVDQTGLTPGRWRRRLRLLRAVELLAEGESVTRTGLAVGYDSTSAFIARFSELFGTTPGQYRTA